MVHSTTTPITKDIGGDAPDGVTIDNAILSQALEDGSTIKSGTTDADNVLFQVYDVDGTTYRTWATVTSGNTPDVSLVTPTGGTASIDGATFAEIARVADVSTRLVALAGSTSITVAAHEGRTCLLTGTGSAYTQTLPAATGSGARFRFVVGAVNTSNHIITTTGGDVFKGVLIANSTTDTPDLGQPWPSSANTIITLNGTTTGGQAVGDWIEVEDIAADTWAVTGIISASDTEETPFSGP